MKSKKLILISCIAIGSLISIENASSQVLVKVKPVRPAVVVVKPAKARKNHIWIDGHWAYSHKLNRYVWIDAKWVKRPRGKAKWVPGHWNKVPGGWKYVPGHWA